MGGFGGGRGGVEDLAGQVAKSKGAKGTKVSVAVVDHLYQGCRREGRGNVGGGKKGHVMGIVDLKGTKSLV